MNDTPISAHGLTRAFYGHLAVSNVSFAVPRGQVFALLGRNGAGKTTTLRMLLGLLEPTAGEARLRDLSPDARAPIGSTASPRAGTLFRFVAMAFGRELRGWCVRWPRTTSGHLERTVPTAQRGQKTSRPRRTASPRAGTMFRIVRIVP